jgi:hypothetical protein
LTKYRRWTAFEENRRIISAGLQFHGPRKQIVALKCLTHLDLTGMEFAAPFFITVNFVLPGVM